MTEPVIAFVDTETTGLDPDLHEIWEVGLIIGEHEWAWRLPVDLGRADPVALRIGGFHVRGLDGKWATKQEFARDFATLTRGLHLAGAVVSFDEERLRKLLRANGACPEWHYHLVDVENLAAGKLGLAPPWDSEALSAMVGVDPTRFARHTALGDARWAKAIYEAVIQ
jgi:hypothetical protein